MSNVLIVVDVQRDFCEGGSLAVIGGAETAKNITDYIDQHRGNYDYIIASKDWHIDPGDHFSDNPDYVNSWPEHCTAGSSGSEFHPLLDAEFDAVFLKGMDCAAYSAFEGKEQHINVHLNTWLQAKEVDEVSVCGIALDYCVRATVVNASELGYDTILIPKLTAAVDGDNFNNIWQEIQKQTGCWIHANT